MIQFSVNNVECLQCYDQSFGYYVLTRFNIWGDASEVAMLQMREMSKAIFSSSL